MLINFDKKIVGQNFSRAAKSYDEAASVQQLAAEELCKVALPFIKDGAKILDLGAGTGFVARHLSELRDGPRHKAGVTSGERAGVTSGEGWSPLIFETDLAFEMLQQQNLTTSHLFKIQSDFEHLPFKNHSFDILISSFSLQWLGDFEKNFSQFSALLKPRGIFAFCLPTEGSLEELKIASAASGCNFHFNILPKIADLKSALKHCGFEEKFCQTKILKSEFDSGLSALKSIKQTGAGYLAKNKFVSKSQLKQFDSFCLKNFCLPNKKIRTSWNSSYLISQKF